MPALIRAPRLPSLFTPSLACALVVAACAAFKGGVPPRLATPVRTVAPAVPIQAVVPTVGSNASAVPAAAREEAPARPRPTTPAEATLPTLEPSALSSGDGTRSHPSAVATSLPELTAVPTPPGAARSASAAPPPPSRDGVPQFSDVSQRGPADALRYLQGRLPEYPGSGPATVLNFSPSDILETMDTVVLDEVRRAHGDAGLQTIDDVIARDVLATLHDEYGDGWVLVALDAGHGGKVGYFWDGGAEGTEAGHARAVVAAIQRLSRAPENRHVIVRTIFNDQIADDFGLPANLDRPTVSSVLLRQIRASMLAAEAAAWNRVHPEAPVAVHEISIHFNAGAGGAMVLHQGETVRPEFVERSVDFGRRYLRRVVADLNATGLLPTPLHRWGGTGLHDDVMMYRPAYASSLPSNVTLRYGALQGYGYAPRYINLILSHQPPEVGSLPSGARSGG